MKTILMVSALVLLLAAVPGRCFAMIGLKNVSREEAKALGMEIHSQPNGPQVWIGLEFKPADELREFDRVDLEIRDGKKFLLSYAPLREKRSASGSVTVGFLADRDFLGKVYLNVITGPQGNQSAHQLRVKDFVGPEKAR